MRAVTAERVSLMEHVERSFDVFIVDHHREIALGGSFGDRQHVYFAAPQCRKHRARDARRISHAVADRRHDRHIFLHVDVAHIAAVKLGGEGPSQCSDGCLALILSDNEADTLLARSLGDHQHINTLLGQGPEDTRGDPRHAEHPGTLDNDQRRIPDRSYSLHVAVARRRDSGNARTHGLRIHRVLDEQRNIVGLERLHGSRVQHFGTEVGQLPGLSVIQLLERKSFRNHPGIS